MARVFHEKVSRSIVKSVVYRVVIVISTAIISFLITHDYGTTFVLVVFVNIANMILYYLHERVWDGIGWGKSKTN